MEQSNIRNGISFNIHETFQDTIQGEGRHSGTACDFIRLYGCPVGCFFCDTGYASPDGEYYKKQLPRTKKTINELFGELKSKLIVISGGEPFIHKKLPILCEELIKEGKDVAIETSGSSYLEVPKEVFITLSPKHHISPKYPVKDEMWIRANEVKLVISDGTELDFYGQKLKDFKGYKYLQPEYFEHESSLQKTLNLISLNKEYKLSLQTHKIIDVL